MGDTDQTTRGAYVSLRDGVTAVLDTVQRLDRVVRSVDIPDSLGGSLDLTLPYVQPTDWSVGL